VSVINRLASSLGRRDDVPNQDLARELAETRSREDIQELVVNLKNRDRNIQSDCIKVLYEIGYIAPELIAEYVEEFLALLNSKNNRLVWGGMIALQTLAGEKASTLYEHRNEIKRAINEGSVITADRGIKALSIVASKNPKYRKELFPYLLNHLAECRPKEVAQNAESILTAVITENKETFIEVITNRMKDVRPSQIRRLKKVIGLAEKR